MLNIPVNSTCNGPGRHGRQYWRSATCVPSPLFSYFEPDNMYTASSACQPASRIVVDDGQVDLSALAGCARCHRAWFRRRNHSLPQDLGQPSCCHRLHCRICTGTVLACDHQSFSTQIWMIRLPTRTQVDSYSKSPTFRTLFYVGEVVFLFSTANSARRTNDLLL